MKLYDVTVSAQVTTTIQVKAETAEEAQTKALEEATDSFLNNVDLYFDDYDVETVEESDEDIDEDEEDDDDKFVGEDNIWWLESAIGALETFEDPSEIQIEHLNRFRARLAELKADTTE